jgi:hypothetical protein
VDGKAVERDPEGPQHRARGSAVTRQRALERRQPAEVVESQDLESFAELERRVATELERGLASGDPGVYAQVFGRLLEHPAAETMAGIGARAYRHADRAPVPDGVSLDFPVGAGMPKSCYEMALNFTVREHTEGPRIALGPLVD